MSCCADCRRSLDPVLLWLWLWCRAAAQVPIQPLAWEFPYAMSSSEKTHTHKHKKKRILPLNIMGTACENQQNGMHNDVCKGINKSKC